MKVLNEAARICKPNGHVLFLHRLVPCIHPNFSSHFKRLDIEGVVGVFTLAGLTHMRALTIFKKRSSLQSPQEASGTGDIV